MRWIDNTAEWTNLQKKKCTGKAGDRNEWRRAVIFATGIANHTDFQMAKKKKRFSECYLTFFVSFEF